MASKGVFKRCGCRCAVTGKQLDARCPRLAEQGHGSWWFAVEGPNLVGRRSRVRRGGYASEEAAKAAREQVAATAKGIGLTTGRWLEDWVCNVRLRPSTRRAYQQHTVTYLIPQLGKLPLVTLGVSDVQKAFTAVADGVGSHNGRLGPSTVARIRATLSSALTSAVGQGLLAHNPARGREIGLPEAVRPRPHVWTDERVARWRATGWRPGPVCVWTREQTIEFLNAIAGHRRYLYYHLVAVTGLRRGEAAALREVDVDLRHHELFVVTRPDPGMQMDDDGKRPADGEAVEPRRMGRLQLLRLPLPLLLGRAPAPDRHPSRAADHLGTGRPEDRRTPGADRRPGPRPHPDPRSGRPDDHRRQRLCLASWTPTSPNAVSR